MGQSLEKYLGHYWLSRPGVKKHRELVKASVRKLASHLGRPPVISDLTDETLNGFLASLADSSLSRWTIKGHRARLLALWRFACEDGLIDREPRKVRSVAVPPLKVEGWNEDQLARLVAAARSQQGCFRRSRISRRDFAVALVLAAYDIGARLGDLERLPVTALDEPVVWWVQGKTGKEQTARFRPETVGAMRKIVSPDRDAIFGGALNRKNFYRFWRGLVKSAGLKGTFRYLRRTSGSLIDRDHPGWGHRHLGNRPDVFRAHYEVRRLTQSAEHRPLPPAIETMVTVTPSAV